MLKLDSGVFSSPRRSNTGARLSLDSRRGSGESKGWQTTESIASALPKRSEQCQITGDVSVVLFDFDGTLTATPGDRAERRFKMVELKERSPMLKPWLMRFREAGISLGIISKSTEGTISAALKEAELQELFNLPIIAKAVGFEGKAGFIHNMCNCGPLQFLGAEGMNRILLVDDDMLELVRAGDNSVQTYPAPETGGLQERDFCEMFERLGLPHPPLPKETKEVLRLWASGITARSMGYDGNPPIIDYALGTGPLFTDFYEFKEELEHLGEGSFGVCRACKHIMQGTPCAVKFVNIRVAGRHYVENFIERDEFTFLLRMAALEPHKNVVKHLDYLMGPTMVYSTMELLSGFDLVALLSENAPLTEGFASCLMHQMLSALKHIHQVANRGIIHRDVKLDNLQFRFPDVRSDLVLIDFGLSCPAKPDHQRGIVGTMMYMAPEIHSGYYSTQVDVWSCGVVFYIILTGKAPWNLDRDAGYNPNQITEGALASAFEVPTIQCAHPLAVQLLKSMLVIAANERHTAAVALECLWFSEPCEIGDGVGGTRSIGLDYAGVLDDHQLSPMAKLGLLIPSTMEHTPSECSSFQGSPNGIEV